LAALRFEFTGKKRAEERAQWVLNGAGREYFIRIRNYLNSIRLADSPHMAEGQRRNNTRRSDDDGIVRGHCASDSVSQALSSSEILQWPKIVWQAND
jgi:hypothetical protein